MRLAQRCFALTCIAFPLLVFSAAADARPVIANADDFDPWPFLAQGDVNRDLQVDVFDMLDMLDNWGDCAQPCPPHCLGDSSADCAVDVFDLLAALGSWGRLI